LRPRQGERARSTKFFLPVSHFFHQNETTAGWQDPKIKFSLKINSPYCPVSSVHLQKFFGQNNNWNSSVVGS
jgi:hypothetical protein